MTIEEIISSQDHFCNRFDGECTGCPLESTMLCASWSEALRQVRWWNDKRETFADHFLKQCPTAMTNKDGIPSIPVFLIYPQAKSWEDEYHD